MPAEIIPFNPNRPKRIIERYAGNPILTGDDFPGDITWVFNSGVVKIDGKYIMLCRVEDAALRRFLWVAESDNGFIFTPRPEPVQVPEDNPDYKEYGTNTYFDPRITQIGDKFYVVYAHHSSHGCRLGLFETNQYFEEFTWKGCLGLPDNRNGVLFPEKFNGMYAKLDRPNTGWGDKGDIWISYSPDLRYWGDCRCVIRTSDFHWCYHKIGGGAVPIKTPQGWLIIFHGVRTQCAQHYVYQLGVFMTALDDPGRVIAKAERAILLPEEEYELIGQTPSVVFTNAAIVEDDGTVKIYYGAADSYQCVGVAAMQDLIEACDSK